MSPLMLTLVAAVLAYDRPLDMAGRDSPLRSRYVRSDTNEEKDIVLLVPGGDK